MSNRDASPTDQPPESRSRRGLLLLGLAWMVVLLGGVAWAFLRGDDPEPAQSANSSTIVTTTPPDTQAQATTTTNAPPPTTAAVPDDDDTTAPDGPVVVARLDGGNFTLAGIVPTDGDAAALLEAAQTSYAPYVDATDLHVDPTVGSAGWLERAPSAIGLIPMITDGTIIFQGDSVALAGRSPNPAYLSFFEETITQIVGVAPSSVDVEITDLVPPIFEANAQDGQIELSGTLPSEDLRDLIVGGATAAYGDGSVSTSIEIDPGTYSSFWMYTMPQVFQLFTVLPEYEFSVIDGVTSGAMRGGITFGFDSAQVDPAAAEILLVAGSILQRDRSLGLLIEGHTDSIGPEDYNESLSLARAQAIVDFLAAAGVDANRMVAVGVGEASPVADNTTPEGRAENRRVEFRFDSFTNLASS